MKTARIGNLSNRYQGTAKKVLCVCSGGLLRSPTAAVILAGEPYNHNTRSCGTSEYALIKLDRILLSWADEVVVMEKEHESSVRLMSSAIGTLFRANIFCLNIPDKFPYRDPELVKLIKERYPA